MQYELMTPELIQVRSSRGLIKDIYDPVSSVRDPLSHYQTMLDLIHRDPTLAAAFGILTEFVTYRGIDAIGGTKDKRTELRLALDDLNWDEVETNLLRSLFYYGDAFLELRRGESSGKVKELFVLETTEMRIVYDIHGEVEGYVQRPFNLSGLSEGEIFEKEKSMGVRFSPDEVIHFRMVWLGSQVYSYNPNEPISQAISTKLYAGNYLMNIFINMPPRYVAHLAGISNSDYLLAKQEFQMAKTNYKKAIAFTKSSDPNSKLQIQKIDPPYDKELIEIIKWLDNQILKVTRVPRHWVEQSDVENRGMGESITLPFEVRVKYIQRKILESKLNNELLPALGFYKKSKDSDSYLKLRYNEITWKGEKEILQNLGLLRDMGLKPDAVVRYLDERGILGLDPTDFDELQLRKNMELNPSRSRMDKSTESMTQNRNSAGVSDESGKKMEAEA